MKPRDFSRDMRSVSRPRRFSRERSGSVGNRRDEKRSGSKEDRREFKNFIGCKCEECIKMRKNAKEMNVQLCNGYELDEEILVNYTEKGKQVMLLDLGVLVSLAGN